MPASRKAAPRAAVLVEHVSSLAEFHDRATDVSLNPKGNEPREKYSGFGKKLTDNQEPATEN
jgi:hypothetical protein